MSLFKSRSQIIVLFLLLWGGCISVKSQKREDFADEVNRISERYASVREGDQKTVVFTGSSSIRLWEGLEQSFPDHLIVNTGFGGSESADLLRYAGPLILDYRPEKVFIYEGDNDLGHRKSPARVLRTTKKILSRIRESLPDAEVILIAAKPSPERWHLKRRFKRLNRRLEKLAEKSTRLEFANIWDVMLNGNELNDSLFVEDGLHMNQKGYALWTEVLKTYLN